MRLSRILLSVFFLTLIIACRLHAQLKFAPESKLSDLGYVEHAIKNIGDPDLFAALQVDRPGLQDVLRSVGRGEFQQAYEHWGAFWSQKKQPRYITRDFQFLLDSEMLKTYDDARIDLARHPAERDSVLARASQLKRNVVTTWGNVVIDFGASVDFNREIGQSGKYGFHYWWWARPLLATYLVTGDQSYLAKFDEYFQRWYDQRNSIARTIPELDVVYYELGLGTRNRVFIEYYLLPYKDRTWRTHERMLKTVLGAARWLYELQRWEGYRPGNWQIHGSYALAQIAMAFPEFKESQEWLRMATQRLGEHLDQDFFEDGGHSERAPRNYTLATYLCYRNISFLLKSYAVSGNLPQRIHDRTANTVDWWITMLAPTGEIPAINDSHRGLFPSFVLQDAAVTYKKPYLYGVLSNLFGVRSDQNPPLLPSFTSRHMPASGFTVMRTDWSRDALYMNVNYGKWNGSHTHFDLLDFEIYAYGKPLAVDAGLGLTYDDPLYIPWYRSTRAHNVVTVNDQNIDREKSEGKNVAWSAGPSLEYFSAEHDGYARLGVRQQRQIIFVKPYYWVVIDDLKCGKNGDTLSWYIHTPLPLEESGAGYQNTGGPGLSVIPVLGREAVRRGRGMAASTSDLRPGRTEEISWLAFDQIASAMEPKRFAVVLAPFRSLPSSVRCTAMSSAHFRIETEGFTDDLYVGPAAFRIGDIESDARCLMIRHAPGKEPQAAIVEATILRISGKEVWKSGTRTSADFSLPSLR